METHRKFVEISQFTTLFFFHISNCYILNYLLNYFNFIIKSMQIPIFKVTTAHDGHSKFSPKLRNSK